jgi:ATP-dependent helicase HepA
MFKKVNGEVPGTFRFKYQSESDHGQRTFLDVQTFVERCVAGIDFDKSDGAAVVTNMMSADRQLVSHGRKVYPFRFGQPFVDVIYDEMQSDTRGICTASYRQHKIKGLAGISAFFKIDYLLTAKPASDNLADRRIADKRLPPKMVSNWFKESGELVGNEVFCQYLDKKEEYDEQIRGEHWEALEEDYSAQYWRETVERVTLGSETNLHQLDIHSDYVTRMLSIKVLFLVSM